jgi:hypothetical protein
MNRGYILSFAASWHSADGLCPLEDASAAVAQKATSERFMELLLKVSLAQNHSVN